MTFPSSDAGQHAPHLCTYSAGMSTATFVAGPCAFCRTPFVARITGVVTPYCSKDCRTRAKKRRMGGQCVGCGRYPNPGIKVRAPICDMCATAVIGSCLRLARYETRAEAFAGISRGPGADIAPFACQLCGGWHLARRGTGRPKVADLVARLYRGGVRIARGTEPALSGTTARRFLTSGAALSRTTAQ